MRGRILVTGMGSELGTLVANRLEADLQVEAVLGVDIDPPRHRIHRADFHMVDPGDRARMVRVVREFEPTAVVHLAVFEPHARTGPALARRLTHDHAVAALGAAARSPHLDRVVVRSGTEVYGRARGAATCPDEAVVPAPTSPFGRSLLHAEEVARASVSHLGVPVAAVRCAPVMGPHMASPLGRLLRLPVVPVSIAGGLPFSLLHLDDAADALVQALERAPDGPVNVVGRGAVTPRQAARIGGRVPLPIAGPQWRVAQVAAELLGAPLPAHVRELLTRGRAADGSHARTVLGIEPRHDTHEVVRDVYAWAPVVYVRTGSAA